MNTELQLWHFEVWQLLTIAASVLIAVASSLLAPWIHFKSNVKLEYYLKSWAIYAGLLAIPVSYGLTFLTPEKSSPLYLVAIAFVAGIGSTVTLTDQEHHRVPNAQTAILYVTVPLALLGDAWITGSWMNLLWGAVGFVAVGVVFLVFYLTGMGMGDLKLFAILAMPIAYVSSQLTFIWIVAGYGMAAVYGIILLAGGAGRGGKMPMVPPFIMALAFFPGMIQAGFSTIW